MKKLTVIIIVLAILNPHSHAEAAQKRSAKAKYQFRKEHICPGPAGTRYGKCEGYVIDHIVPLCAGGADNPANMQWQTVTEAKAKDRLERKQCAALRKARNGH
ncbi:MAG TPA: HNH endonuclease [Methylophilaceae bacterium]|nr:HNH endonuclease [Methylophilaceae bacterium]